MCIRKSPLKMGPVLCVNSMELSYGMSSCVVVIIILIVTSFLASPLALKWVQKCLASLLHYIWIHAFHFGCSLRMNKNKNDRNTFRIKFKLHLNIGIPNVLCPKHLKTDQRTRFCHQSNGLFKQVYHQFRTILTAPLPDVEDSALWS